MRLGSALAPCHACARRACDSWHGFSVCTGDATIVDLQRKDENGNPVLMSMVVLNKLMHDKGLLGEALTDENVTKLGARLLACKVDKRRGNAGYDWGKSSPRLWQEVLRVRISPGASVAEV